MRSAQLREEKSAHTALIASSRVAELAAAAAAAQLQSQLLEQHKQVHRFINRWCANLFFMRDHKILP
jgi:hypothetical protein